MVRQDLRKAGLQQGSFVDFLLDEGIRALFQVNYTDISPSLDLFELKIVSAWTRLVDPFPHLVYLGIGHDVWLGNDHFRGFGLDSIQTRDGQVSPVVLLLLLIRTLLLTEDLVSLVLMENAVVQIVGVWTRFVLVKKLLEALSASLMRLCGHIVAFDLWRRHLHLLVHNSTLQDDLVDSQKVGYLLLDLDYPGPVVRDWRRDTNTRL